MAIPALIVVAAYLWAAIPSAYLVGRYLKNIDIRRYGTGNVGASNIMEHVGFWTGFSLGVFDSVGKGTLPVVAAKLLDQSLAVQVGVGLAAIAGHNWSPYLRFTGGRGVATTIGVAVGFLLWREVLIGVLIMGVIGRLIMHETGLWTLVAMISLPLQAYFFREETELIYLTLGIALILVIKRLIANWERPAGGHPLPRVLVYRLLWDRDVPRSEEWTGRRPGLL